MNIVFNNLLKISIDNLFIVNKHELKDVDKKKLNYIYRFSRTGCKFNDDNFDNYSNGIGVDPVGGVEAIISHYISKELKMTR